MKLVLKILALPVLFVVKVICILGNELTPKEKEIWMLFDRVDVAELLARDAFAKGAYMLGAEDREIMLK